MNTRVTWAFALGLTLAAPAMAFAAASPLADAARQQDRAAIRALIKQKGETAILYERPAR